jgi:hypothetical protein
LEEGVRRPWRKRTAAPEVAGGKNRKLKQLVADLSLDKHILQDVLAKKP